MSTTLQSTARRLIGSFLAALMVMLLQAAALAPVSAAEGDCQLSVEPAFAPAGSQFQLSGSGYTPTQLTLQKEGDDAVTIDLELGDADPFELPIASRTGQEGRWTATATLPGVCSPSVTFTVTLASTDAIDDLLSTSTSRRLPLAIVGLIIAVGLSGGVLIGRRLLQRA
jgi:hypothetical protein